MKYPSCRGFANEHDLYVYDLSLDGDHEPKEFSVGPVYIPLPKVSVLCL